MIARCSTTPDVPSPPADARALTLGAVFCGGRSRRLGTDKALLLDPSSGLPWAERAARVLEAVAGRVVLACGPEPRYGELDREIVLDAESEAGPLAGLVAALELGLAGGLQHVVALACDMPGVDADAIHGLVRHARDEGLDVCMLSGRGGVEPLCAVYHTRCAPHARRALEAGGRRVIAFHGLEAPGTSDAGLVVGTWGDGPGQREDIVGNVNTPADYQRWMGERPGGER